MHHVNIDGAIFTPRVWHARTISDSLATILKFACSFHSLEEDQKMKTIIIAALVSLSASISFAQQAPDTTTSPPASQADTAPSSNSPQSPPSGQHHPPEDNAMRGTWHRDWMSRRPTPSKAARFRIENGDVKIYVKCADDEPMKACADELNQILDRLDGRSSSRGDDYQ
jgi:hypothetical protein